MYCSELDEEKPHSTGKQYNDCFSDEYEEILKELDRYVYLIDMHRIIDDCANDIENVYIDNKYAFWKANKCLLNYVNAVFSFKEFIRKNDPTVDCISEPYWNAGGWYRIICELRNVIVHQSTIIKDYNPDSENIFINLDELIERQRELADDPKNKRRNDAKALLKHLERMKDKSKEIDGQLFLDMKYVARQTGKEIEKMFQGIIEYLYEIHIKEILEKLISMLYWKNDVNQYVFIVDNETEPTSIYEPNTTLEQFYFYMQHSLGMDNSITKKMEDLLINNNYRIFYDTDEDDF